MLRPLQVCVRAHLKQEEDHHRAKLPFSSKKKQKQKKEALTRTFDFVPTSSPLGKTESSTFRPNRVGQVAYAPHSWVLIFTGSRRHSRRRSGTINSTRTTHAGRSIDEVWSRSSSPSSSRNLREREAERNEHRGRIGTKELIKGTHGIKSKGEEGSKRRNNRPKQSRNKSLNKWLKRSRCTHECRRKRPASHNPQSMRAGKVGETRGARAPKPAQKSNNSHTSKHFRTTMTRRWCWGWDLAFPSHWS